LSDCPAPLLQHAPSYLTCPGHVSPSLHRPGLLNLTLSFSLTYLTYYAHFDFVYDKTFSAACSQVQPLTVFSPLPAALHQSGREPTRRHLCKPLPGQWHAAFARRERLLRAGAFPAVPSTGTTFNTWMY
jgi:hypothetical protein